MNLHKFREAYSSCMMSFFVAIIFMSAFIFCVAILPQLIENKYLAIIVSIFGAVNLIAIAIALGESK